MSREVVEDSSGSDSDETDWSAGGESGDDMSDSDSDEDRDKEEDSCATATERSDGGYL